MEPTVESNRSFRLQEEDINVYPGPALGLHGPRFGGEGTNIHGYIIDMLSFFVSAPKCRDVVLGSYGVCH